MKTITLHQLMQLKELDLKVISLGKNHINIKAINPILQIEYLITKQRIKRIKEILGPEIKGHLYTNLGLKGQWTKAWDLQQEKNPKCRIFIYEI